MRQCRIPARYRRSSGRIRPALFTLSDGIKDELTSEQKLIDDETARVDDLQTRLQAQMAAADALIAQMEQQASYMTSMIQVMTQNSKNS